MQESKYLELLRVSAAETNRAISRRFAGVKHKEPTIFDAVRSNNTHDEMIVINKFAEMAGVTRDDLLSYNNKATISLVRNLIAYTLHVKLGLTLKMVGVLTKRDNSTVLTSARGAAKAIESNKFLADVVEDIVRQSIRKDS